MYSAFLCPEHERPNGVAERPPRHVRAWWPGAQQSLPMELQAEASQKRSVPIGARLAKTGIKCTSDFAYCSQGPTYLPPTVPTTKEAVHARHSHNRCTGRPTHAFTS